MEMFRGEQLAVKELLVALGTSLITMHVRLFECMYDITTPALTARSAFVIAVPTYFSLPPPLLFLHFYLCNL